MEISSYDLLIVGGGGAGLRAAIELAEAAPHLSVAVVSKVYPMRSHTVAAEGGAAGVARTEDSFDAHAYDTVSGGAWLCDQDAVDLFVEEAPRELARLERWGCPFSRDPDGRIAVRPFGGMKNERTWFAADRTGFHLLHTLYQTALRHERLRFLDEWLVTRLLVDDGRCQGAVALELATGRVHALLARAVILTTGGAGRVYPFTTNGAIKTGDGMALAYRAGVPLKDMEFVQYHPTGLPGSGVLITEAARGEGGWLLNKDGRRYLQDYDLGRPEPIPVKRAMELGPRDRLSQAFAHEDRAGRTIETPGGRAVHLDLRHLGEAVIDRKLPFVRELCRQYANLDPVHEPIPVRPVVHYTMGGVHTDKEGRTPLPGLYAAGEVACVSINGANRLGSNSLPELLVFGARAARRAAAQAQETPAPTPRAVELAREEENRLRGRFLTGGGRERLAPLRRELQAAMEDGAGIYRDGPGLRRAADRLRAARARYAEVGLEDRGAIFNTELQGAIELGHMLDVADAIVHAALARTESRGAHQRTDHPRRDDDRFLVHSLAFRGPREGAPPRLETLPVTITRWPPGERRYGQ
jgi:fumarate reductase flavoprotein subunit